MKFFSTTALIAALSLGASQATAETFVMDPTHSAIKFSWGHGDFSTTYGMFFEVTGEIDFNQDDPAASSVTASFPLDSMFVDPTLKGHLAGDRWFNGLDKAVTFTSTSIEVTGDDTALITGDLSVGDTSATVVLDATMNALGDGPRGGTIAGFDATTTILRSEFGVGAFAPFVSDEVAVEISIEASPAG